MAIPYVRKTPRTMPEAFGDGARLYIEPRYIATIKQGRHLIRAVVASSLPFVGSAAIGAILYVAFVIGVTRG